MIAAFVHQTPSGILPRWGGLAPRSDNRPAPFARHLEAFLDLHPDRARRALLVCRAARPEQLSERVRAIPWHAP